MNHAEDLAYLTAKVPAFEAILHGWANQLRELQREVDTGTGDGNAELTLRQEVKSARVTRTLLVPPPVQFWRRNGQ